MSGPFPGRSNIGSSAPGTRLGGVRDYKVPPSSNPGGLGGGGGIDPDLASVRLLMPFDTSLTADLSDGYTNAISYTGSPVIDASVKKWGDGAFSTTNAATDETLQIISDDSGGFSAGLSAFTLECWLYFISSTNTTVSRAGSRNNVLSLILGAPSSSPVNYPRCLTWCSEGGGRIDFVGAHIDGVAPGIWHHVALVYDGVSSTIAIGINGAIAINGSWAAENSFDRFYLGNMGYIASHEYDSSWSDYVTSYKLDDLRFTAGVARYTGSSYVVPSGPFPAP
jgi:hypothetical protein